MKTSKLLDGSFDKENLPEFLTSLSKQTSGSKEKKNIRRGKRSLIVNTSATPLEKKKQQEDEMLGINFQEEIKNLRAEVRSQAASECEADCTPLQMIKPISNRLSVHTPSRRLYPNICPGTAPSKRKRVETDSSCWTPQVHRKVNSSFRRRLGSADELPQRDKENKCDEEWHSNFNQTEERFDDERPALEEDDVRTNERNIHMMKQQSLFEKVQTWQKQSIDKFPSKALPQDKDGFKIPLVTPRPMKHKLQYRRLPSRGKPFGELKTPTVNWTSKSCLQYAPKKKESTKRRRPIASSDEGFYDELRAREETSSSDVASGIRRTLSFDTLKDPTESYDEAPHAVQEEHFEIENNMRQCTGCKPVTTLNSCTLIKELESHHYTCSFHQEFAKKLLESYEDIQQQQQQLKEQQQPQRQQEPFKIKRTLRSNSKMDGKKVVKKSLTGRERDWGSMSVFSYRSTHSQRSYATEKSVSLIPLLYNQLIQYFQGGRAFEQLKIINTILSF